MALEKDGVVDDGDEECGDNDWESVGESDELSEDDEEHLETLRTLFRRGGTLESRCSLGRPDRS